MSSGWTSMFGSQPAPQPSPQGTFCTLPSSIHLCLEMLKANKKGINRSKRDLDKEIRALERQEAKVQLEIKQLARKVSLRCGFQNPTPTSPDLLLHQFLFLYE